MFTVLLVTLLVLPSGFSIWSLSNTLGVVRVPVPVTTKLSGTILTVGVTFATVIVVIPVTQLVGVAVVHTW